VLHATPIPNAKMGNRRVSDGPSDQSAEARFGRRIKVRPDGCWAFGDIDTYGTVNYSRKGGAGTGGIAAHRFAYETLVGPIHDGHVLHHTCERPGCVNPAHLMPLTPGEHAQEHARLRAEQEVASAV
jgi:hypothetical protein